MVNQDGFVNIALVKKMKKSKKQLIDEINNIKREIRIQENKNDKTEREMLKTLSIKDLKEELMYYEIELYDLKGDV